jgi:putative mRNA 3-end processing factor
VLDDLIVNRPQGLYCPPGDFYIDPWRPVPRAVITHAHADHARRGHGAYLATAISAGVLQARLGNITLQGVAYGEAVHINGVRVSLHPAGHVLGSAQVRVEHRGQVWVASGDYFVRGSGAGGSDQAGEVVTCAVSYTQADNLTCTAFEPVRCHCFITESTFGLPIYHWQPTHHTLAAINAWWQANAAQGRPSLLLAYSFGKAQRVLAGVDASIGPLVVHSAVAPLNAAYRAAGVALPPTCTPDEAKAQGALGRALVVAPPAVKDSAWARKLGDKSGEASTAFASGWMQMRGARRRQGVDQGFVLSDHADWPGLQRAIAATGASRVIVTHGYEAVMVRWLQQQGLQAGSFHTEYGQDAAADGGDGGGEGGGTLAAPVANATHEHAAPPTAVSADPGPDPGPAA